MHRNNTSRSLEDATAPVTNNLRHSPALIIEVFGQRRSQYLPLPQMAVHHPDVQIQIHRNCDQSKSDWNDNPEYRKNLATSALSLCYIADPDFIPTLQRRLNNDTNQCKMIIWSPVAGPRIDKAIENQRQHIVGLVTGQLSPRQCVRVDHDIRHALGMDPHKRRPLAYLRWLAAIHWRLNRRGEKAFRLL